MKYQYTVNIVTTTLVGVLQIILLQVSKKVLKLFGRITHRTSYPKKKIVPLMIFTLIIASSNFNGSAVVSSFSSAGSSNTGGQKQIQVRILFKMYYIIIYNTLQWYFEVLLQNFWIEKIFCLQQLLGSSTTIV